MPGLTEPPAQLVPLRRRAPARDAADPLDGKYGVPRLHQDLVCRADLLGRLEDAQSQPLVLVTAPAGYGKTCLLAEWSERSERAFAWVNLDEADNDPKCLRNSLMTALAWAEIDPASHGFGFVLVLDNGQSVDPGVLGDEVLRALAWLPTGSQIALASRSEPRLPMGKMRGSRTVCEIDADGLSMSAVEGASLLRRAGLDLDFMAVQEIVRRTEGWPVVLELTAGSLAAKGSPVAGVAQVAGDDHLIADYFRSEVLDPLPRAARRFLIRSSVLDRMSGPLCDAVLERTRSAAVLSRLAGTNVPLRPTDPSQEWFRLHGMFREMLRTELRRTMPAAAAELHRRACDWHRGKDGIERAIDHAHMAGDARRTGELLLPNLLRYLSEGRNDTVQRWVVGLTAEDGAESPSLAVAAAHSHLAAGNIAMAERWARSAAASESDDPAIDSKSRQAGLLIVQAWAARSGAEQMGKDAARAYRLLSDASPWRASCCFLRGSAALLAGGDANARRYLEEGVGRGASEAPDAAMLSLAQLAALAIDHGDHAGAGDLARRAIDLAVEHDLGSMPIAALTHAVSAAAAVGEGRVDEAKTAASRCVGLLPALKAFAPWYGAETRIFLARAALALGQVVDAREQLATASRLARRAPVAEAFTRWFDDAWDQFDRRAEGAPLGVASLTPAELRVLRFLPTHYAFHEIASRLHVSPNTVKTHVHAVYRKLDASSRSEAVVNATGAGLLGY